MGRQGWSRIKGRIKDGLSSAWRYLWNGAREDGEKRAPHWYHFPILAITAALLTYWLRRPPVPNRAVLALAAVAALMVLADMRPIHKALYFVLVLGLVIVENNAITKEHDDFEKDRLAANCQFNQIASDLKLSMQENRDKFKLLQDAEGAQILLIDSEISLLQESERLTKTSAEQQLKISILDVARNIFELNMQNFRTIASLPTPATHGTAAMNDPAWKLWEVQVEMVYHNSVADFNVRLAPSVQDVMQGLHQRGWTSSECDRALVRSYEGPASSQFLYVGGCGGDLQRAANDMH